MKRRSSVRARIALICAGLFLATGAVLIGVTYALLDHNLPAIVSAPGVVPDATLLNLCQQNPTDPNLIAKCKTAYAAGAAAGAQQQRDQVLSGLLLYASLSLVVLTLVAGGAGWALAGRALRPLRQVTEAARRASERNLGERLAIGGPRNELRELADTFDGMLDRLDAAFAAQRRFVANASHELRTPLTVMRTSIDVTLAKPNRTPEQLTAMAVEVRQAVAGAEALIDALLTLARSDQGRVGTEFVDLATAAEDALDAAADARRAQRIRVEPELESAETFGDRVLLERMVANLVDNAVRHNVPDGWLRISTGEDDGAVRLTVSNSGPVVPPELAPSLFEPFRRLHDRIGSEHGVGLGLSIVRAVVTTHGGQVEATAAPEGGLTVSVLLPARVS